MKKIKKRNGEFQNFDKTKISTAIEKAFIAIDGELDDSSKRKSREIANVIEGMVEERRKRFSVEEIQDIIEERLQSSKRKDVAAEYIRYRYKKSLVRNTRGTYESVLKLVDFDNEELKEENSNKNAIIASTQRDYMAGEVSKDLTRQILLPEAISNAHDEGLIHFHDSDYFAQRIHNCCLVNLEDMLQNGTIINGTLIEKPHRFSTACNIATQIIACVASGQYGGQSITLSHLAPFVNESRKRIKAQVIEELDGIEGVTFDKINDITESRLRREIKDGVQVMQYQINTLNTSNGQTPFVTVFMYLGEVEEGQLRDDLALIIEEVIKQRMQGTKNDVGVWVSPAFPKLIYCLEEDNIHEGDKYWYLTELSARCSAKRLVPDYISEKQMMELKGDVYPCMGCRSFLTPDRFTDNDIGNIAKAGNYEEGKHRYYGRFNQGVVTINLPDVALSAIKEKDNKILNDSNNETLEEIFWEIFDDRLELCHEALQLRHKRLLGTPSDISPIHWQNGALARLDKGETIDKLLFNGYSTISLGYAGLWECVYALTGKKLTESEGEELGLAIMQKMNDKCAEWKYVENIDYSLYGTPIESTTYKFAKCLKKRFGVIEGVTDKEYITNSYHIHVTEPINAFSKLALESKFQALSPGGAVSYVEVPDMQNNIEAVLSVIQFIYDNILYAEINTKSDYCMECGFDGEILIEETEDGKLEWVCPNCGNRDHSKLNVARRTCGYIGSQFWNQGRTAEIRDRVLHL